MQCIPRVMHEHQIIPEEKSKDEVWQVLGWPYGTSVAMARIVCSGMFDRLPDMKIVTHHLRAMIRISKAEWGHYGISFVLCNVG